MSGILLIDKPVGPTSFDVVQIVRRATRLRKVGHAGTLDPLASGLLVVCLDQGTKLVPYLMQGDKRYLATVALGDETDTDDADGRVVESSPVPELSREAVLATLELFRGEIEQVPPRFSALKSEGEPLYRKARRGESIALKPRKVRIHTLDLLELAGDKIRLDVCCSKGTYVRSLARDLGRALGTHAHLADLRRTHSSDFTVGDALRLTELDSLTLSGDLTTRIIPLERALPDFAAVRLDADAERLVLNGSSVPAVDTTAAIGVEDGELLCLLGSGGRLIAVARLQDRALKPLRVFP